LFKPIKHFADHVDGHQHFTRASSLLNLLPYNLIELVDAKLKLTAPLCVLSHADWANSGFSPLLNLPIQWSNQILYQKIIIITILNFLVLLIYPFSGCDQKCSFQTISIFPKDHRRIERFSIFL
jgi:hypothetical protein